MKNYRTEIDNYGSLYISLSQSNTNIDLKSQEPNKPPQSFIPSIENLCGNIYEKNEPTFIMRNIFFLYNCEKNKDGTRSLLLNGNQLFSKIGRRFKNWDVPYLEIFLINHKDVKSINLEFNDIQSAGFINLINYLTKHDHISELNVRHNHIGEPGINYMFRNGKELKVKILRLGGNKIGIKINNLLRHLDVADTDQNESSLVYFTTVLRSDQKQFNNTLKVLDLSRPHPQCMYSVFDSSHVAATIGLMLRHNESLEELYLKKFNFSCHDVEEMFKNSTHNKTLRLIDLSCNNIGDHGVEIISNWLKKRPSLRSLLLAHNIISNHGASALSRGIPFSKLLELDISHNRFDDEGAVEIFYTIKKSPAIEKIRIYGNNIGHPTAVIIERMLLSKVLNQENIDIRLYQIDGIFYVAPYHRASIK